MKIIFDSEEQKKEFENTMDDWCPSFLGLKGDCDRRVFISADCSECWKHCGLEKEVRGE